MAEAREKRIAEDRKKREQALDKLMQKAPTELITASYFKTLDEEENKKRIKEELELYPPFAIAYCYIIFLTLARGMRKMEEEHKRNEEKERMIQEQLERKEKEKEAKRIQREENDRAARAEKATQKVVRREEYPKQQNKSGGRRQKKIFDR